MLQAISSPARLAALTLAFLAGCAGPGGSRDDGPRPGDVLESINGHPVASVSEAIDYVRTNAGTSSKWDLVVVRDGRKMTLTYDAPPAF